MSTNSVSSQLLKNLKENKKYREAFVAEHIATTIPFQLRAIRKKLRMTQKQLGKDAGMAPERITVLEDPNYARFTLSTLLRLADALDVALIVRFAPFSELLRWASNLSDEAVAVLPFEEEQKLESSVTQTPFHENESVLRLIGAKQSYFIPDNRDKELEIKDSLLAGPKLKQTGNGFPPGHSKSHQPQLAGTL